MTAEVHATDTCGAVQVVLLSIASSEPDDAPGGSDGHTTGDVREAEPGTADFKFRLRAERDTNGPGRRYTIVYQATDAAGNTATARGVVRVAEGGAATPVPFGVR